MALLQPDHGDPGEDRVTSGTVGGDEALAERRLLRDGFEVIARGSLVCSECDLPLPGRPAVRASEMLSCSWCGHEARARELLRHNVADTEANAVALVARLA